MNKTQRYLLYYLVVIFLMLPQFILVVNYFDPDIRPFTLSKVPFVISVTLGWLLILTKVREMILPEG